jgi:hypothetical protein
MIREDNHSAGEEGCGNYGAFLSSKVPGPSSDSYTQGCVINAKLWNGSIFTLEVSAAILVI